MKNQIGKGMRFYLATLLQAGESARNPSNALWVRLANGFLLTRAFIVASPRSTLGADCIRSAEECNLARNMDHGLSRTEHKPVLGILQYCITAATNSLKCVSSRDLQHSHLKAREGWPSPVASVLMSLTIRPARTNDREVMV
jgi:hypothetical protein